MGTEDQHIFGGRPIRAFPNDRSPICGHTVAISFFYRSGGARESGLFDSPNQLGYFAGLGASVIVIGQRRLGISLQHATIGLCAALYLSLLSSSKAALGAVGILAVLGLFHRPRTIIVATLVFAALLQWSEHVQSALHGAVDRIRNDETLGFFEERGYDRIVNNPEYLLFGAGEGAMRRFKDTTLIGTHEIHSSGGTLFFCYGIVGVLLFVVFLLRVVEGMRLRFALLLLPALAYGITHQGLRFTFLWVLIAMMISLKNVERQRRAAAMPPAPVRTAREAAPDAVPPGGSS